MPYGSNLVINGDASSSTNWVLTNTTIKTGSALKGNYFEMAATASMRQDIAITDINTSAREYLLSVDYMYKTARAINDMDTRAYMRVEMHYLSGAVDHFIVPFTENASGQSATEGVWYTTTSSLYARANETLTQVVVWVLTVGANGLVGVDNLSLKRNITDLEEHDTDVNPHQLPLAIGVGSFGIKATKGTDVMFWLKDDGDAIYNGKVKAAQIDAAFGKITVAQIEELIVGSNVQMGPNAYISWGHVTNQPNIAQEAVTAVNATYIDQNGVWTPAVYATHINTALGKITTAQIENLTVGGNVAMGPNAYISWGNVTSQPFIPDSADDIGALSASSPKLTYIGPNGIYTGTLTADQVNAVEVVAQRLRMPGNANNYGTIGGSYGDMILYYNLSEYFRIYNGIGSVDLKAYGNSFLRYSDVTDKAYALGAWDFNGATVSGLTARFA